MTDAGFAIGLCTHVERTRGELVWMADGFWQEEPTAAEVDAVTSWRWCTFFPLHGAARRRLVTPLGVVAIPRRLRRFPDMRSGSTQDGWTVIRNGQFDAGHGRRTKDRDLPLAFITNDTRLKERLVSGWMPRDVW